MTKTLRLSGFCKRGNSPKRTKLDVLCEQILDSAIIGGISGISAYVSAGTDASFKSFFIAFALAFLVKLKEYRNVG